MPSSTPKKTRLSVSVTGRQKKTLEQMAKRNDVSVSRVVQEAIKEFVNVHSSGQLALFTSEPNQR